jgi:tetratricopeptide (TPR) repeat protein
MKTPALLVFLVLLPGFKPDADLHDAIDLYERGKFSQAAKLLQQLRSITPSDPGVRLWLGKSYLKIRDWNLAVQEMDTAVQLQPSDARYHLWLGRACGARASHSIFVTALSWARRVAKEFETARKLAPEDLDVRFDLLDYYLNAPGIVGGGKEKAEAEAQAIAKLDIGKGYTARATVYIKNKDWDMARKQLSQAVLEYPQSVSACSDLADFLLDRNDFEGALSFAKKALLLDGNSKQARFIAAAAKTRLRVDLDEGAGTLQDLAAGTLSDRDPAFEEVYYWLGECFLAKGDKVKAREAFKTALAFDSDFGRAKDSLSKLK